MMPVTVGTKILRNRYQAARAGDPNQAARETEKTDKAEPKYRNGISDSAKMRIRWSGQRPR